MSSRVFTQIQIYEKHGLPKEKDKSIIRCLECCDRNIYIGTKDSVVQHLVLPSGSSEEPDLQQRAREGRTKKLGSSSPVTQLKAVPVLNHLLVLLDRSLTALNMFSLEPVSSLKKIQHVSLFEVCASTLTTESQAVRVELVTASSRRREVRIHVVGVDRWECVKEVAMPQDPVALAVDGTSLCVATSDRYLLHDYKTGSGVDLFSHHHGRQNVIVSSAGKGEFLLNGPASLGMFVMKTGVCQRPPLQWPEGVLAAAVCFPYVLALQPQVLCVYSMLDQQLKQTVVLNGGQGLLSATDCVYVFAERQILSLSLVPLEEQIESLVEQERLEEALVLLEGVQSHLQPHGYKNLHKTITCIGGFVEFYREAFSKAQDLFIEGKLDPREIICLYPAMKPQLCDSFTSQLVAVTNCRSLLLLQQEERAAFTRYQSFLGDYLRVVRGSEQGLRYSQDVDCALLTLYAEQGDTGGLTQLLSTPTSCRLNTCVPVLEQHNRFFALGLLYQSHGQQQKAIETWVKIADGLNSDTSCTNVYEHIVRTLSQLWDRDVVWASANWALQRNQEVGVQIFTKRDPGDKQLFRADEVITFLKKYPVALMSYLEFLVHDLNSKAEKHHTLLALAYVAQTLQAFQKAEEADSDGDTTREKLQRLLWQSTFYNAATLYESVQPTVLHIEKAILLGREGNHSQALQILVHHERDPQAAGAYCHRVARDQSTELRHTLFLTLLQIYLGSAGMTGHAVDLLNQNPKAFDPVRVIQELPEGWSLQLVSQFLLGFLREAIHQRRMVGVQRALSEAELFRHKVAWTQASKPMLRLVNGEVCNACQRAFTEPQFVCGIGGKLIHPGCRGNTGS
ncbi:transforming growth factor-beta receptor-associated protein 1 [Aplochiton taeniatus]